jgi:hypothetical protein
VRLCHDDVVNVTLRYFDGCPNWQTADVRIRQVLDATGRADVTVNHEVVETLEEAERLGFAGSPTLLIDGRDAFAAPGASVGLACRVYPTPDGLAGSPTVEQLTEVLL